jgi:hypothetical protein
MTEEEKLGFLKQKAVIEKKILTIANDLLFWLLLCN